MPLCTGVSHPLLDKPEGEAFQFAGSWALGLEAEPTPGCARRALELGEGSPVLLTRDPRGDPSRRARVWGCHVLLLATARGGLWAVDVGVPQPGAPASADCGVSRTAVQEVVKHAKAVGFDKEKCSCNICLTLVCSFISAKWSINQWRGAPSLWAPSLISCRFS